MQSCYYMQLRIVAYNLAVMDFFKSCFYTPSNHRTHQLKFLMEPLLCFIVTAVHSETKKIFLSSERNLHLSFPFGVIHKKRHSNFSNFIDSPLIKYILMSLKKEKLQSFITYPLHPQTRLPDYRFPKQTMVHRLTHDV